ncbi:MAG: hypothetical protein V9H69_23515 [Anaerolineae bacterium]
MSPASIVRSSIAKIATVVVVAATLFQWAGLSARPAAAATHQPARLLQTSSAGYALNFDGVDDQAMLGQTGPMLGAGWESNKTVELWVKPTGDALSGPSPAHLDLVFGDRPRWWGISRGVLQGQDRIWVWNYDGNYDMIAVEYTAGQWAHIALVHSGGLLPRLQGRRVGRFRAQRRHAAAQHRRPANALFRRHDHQRGPQLHHERRDRRAAAVEHRAGRRHPPDVAQPGAQRGPSGPGQPARLLPHGQRRRRCGRRRQRPRLHRRAAGRHGRRQLGRLRRLWRPGEPGAHGRCAGGQPG